MRWTNLQCSRLSDKVNTLGRHLASRVYARDYGHNLVRGLESGAELLRASHHLTLSLVLYPVHLVKAALSRLLKPARLRPRAGSVGISCGGGHGGRGGLLRWPDEEASIPDALLGRLLLALTHRPQLIRTTGSMD